MITSLKNALTIQKQYLLLFIIIAGFFILGLLRLNDLSIYTDSTRYVIWGNSFAHGYGFTDNTQPEPESYVVNAPLFSVVLSPVFLAFPFSVLAAKVLTLLLGCAAVALLYYWSRTRLGNAGALAASFLFAFNPLTVVLATEVLSETAFLCLIFLALLLIDRSEESELSAPQKILFLVLISALPLLREIGFAFVAACILPLLLRKRFKESAAAAAAAIVPFLLWTRYNTSLMPATSQSANIRYTFDHFVTSPGASMMEELSRRFVINASHHCIDLGGMIAFTCPGMLLSHPGASVSAILSSLPATAYCIVPLFTSLLFLGLYSNFRGSKQGKFLPIFLGLYLCIIFAYPVLDIRFLFPLFPFTLFYCIAGFRFLVRRFQAYAPHLRAAGIAGIFLIFLPNAVCLTEILKANIRYCRNPTEDTRPSSFFSTPWSFAKEWIDKNVPEGSVVATPYKEIAVFAPRCKFLEVNRGVPLPMFESLIRSNGASFLLTSTLFGEVPEYFVPITESRRFRFQFLTGIGSLRIYAIRSAFLEPACIGCADTPFSAGPAVPDTAVTLFKCERSFLRSGNYPEALNILSDLESRFPGRPALLYQQFIVHSLKPDEPAAAADFQHLYSISANTYLSTARVLLQAAQSIHNAQSMSDAAARGGELFKAGKTYWDLGYGPQAYNTLRDAVRADSLCFMGLIWAWHIGNQLQMQERDEYLQRLDRIDAANPVVRTFHSLKNLQDSLARANDADVRGDILCRISALYENIELTMEAGDAAESAVGASPKNTRFRDYLCTFYRRHNISSRVLYKSDK
jgi:tetratricopeptide (TPR) repeat protein